MTIAGQKPLFEVIHLYDAPTASSRPLWEQMGTEAPQPRRLLLRVHAPAHLMSAQAAARLVLRHYADYHPKATLIFDRDDGVLTLRAMEVGIDAKVLRHADFGVCEVSSRNASQ
jgi:hypothetical protein